MIVLGINAYHGDSSACLVKNGVLIAAAEEERFRRIKHWAGFPSEAIRYCMQAANIGLHEIDHVAINTDPKANLLKKVGFTLTKHPDFGLVMDRIKNAKERTSLEEELERAFHGSVFKGKIQHVEHHLAHLASSFLVAPFEDATAVSIDGFGDFASAAWGQGKGASIEVEERIYFPHSLGIFYQAVTQYLGFPHYGDEYKVMGLAPYGKPSVKNQIRELVRLQNDGGFRLNLDFFRHHKEKVEYEWNNGIPSVGRLYTEALEQLLGPARSKDDELTQHHKDVAYSAQAVYEEACFHLLNALHARYGQDNLVLAGGCAMNSVANGKIYQRTPFKKAYIQAAAGDAGGAIGAAFFVHYKQSGETSRRFVMHHGYWGPEFADREIETIVEKHRPDFSEQACKVTHITDEAELCRSAAERIADGKVIGWFQGRMEWGPRALGNRSILCDPRRADMKDILNRKIKRRESFRPFAPSILREEVANWFETDDDVPFMMKVFQIREDRRAGIPAVTHVDGSGRLQTVKQTDNPRYYRLISSIRDLTGIPIVLNTSFNENEPVVCRPEEAVACFLRTKMDVLVLGDWFIERRD